MDGLKDLEQKVSAACERLEALRKQNRTLKTKVNKLESELAGGVAGGWREEREEVRKRVSQLARGLEGLV